LNDWTRESARDLAEREEVARAREASWSVNEEAGIGLREDLEMAAVVGAMFEDPGLFWVFGVGYYRLDDRKRFSRWQRS
jgi:hypothetical protein